MFSTDDIIALRFAGALKRLIAGVADVRGLELTDAAILIAVMARNVAHIDQNPDLADQWLFLEDERVPVDFRRPTPVRSAADDLGLSLDDTRERLRLLAGLDMIQENAAGVVLQQRVEGPGFGDVYVSMNALLFRDFIGRLASAGCAAPAVPRLNAMAGASPAPQRAIMRISAAFVIDTLAAFARASGGDVIDAMLLIDLAAAEAGEGPLRSGEPISPRPFRADQLADITSLPAKVATARLDGLRDRGLVIEAESGLRLVWPSEAPSVELAALLKRLDRLADVYEARLARRPGGGDAGPSGRPTLVE